MAAGGSARDQARRHRERAQKAQRRAEAWERGAAGERQVAQVLAGLPPEYVVFHDLRLPAPSKTNVDHLVVGPDGIVVIDTKNYSYPVTLGTGKGRGTLWNGRHPMRKELAACAWEAEAVSDLIGYPVEPMMCVIAPSVPSSAFDFGGIRICTPSSLIREVEARSVEPTDVESAAQVVESVFQVTRTARRRAGKAPIPVAHTGQLGPSDRPGRRAAPATLTKLAGAPLVRVAAIGIVALVALSMLPTVAGWLGRAAGEAASEAAQRAIDRTAVTTPVEPTRSVASTVSSIAPTTLPDVGPPPAVNVVLRCPSAGSKWQLSWIWPGDLPAGASGYAVRTRVDDGPALTYSWGWRSPDDPPRSIQLPAMSFTVITDYVDETNQLLSRTEELFDAPSARC